MTAPKPRPKLIRAMAGEHERERRAYVEGPLRTGDREIDLPERPCACCGNRFKPTIKRRLTCHPCFTGTKGPHGAGDFAA